MKKPTHEILIDNATTRGKVCQCLPLEAGIAAPRAASAALVVGFLDDLAAVAYGQRVLAREIEAIKAAFLAAANLEEARDAFGGRTIRPKK